MKKAKIYEQIMVIPTYEVGKEEKNPMFFEKRVYQGSSGKVYPNPVIEKICDDKIDKEYRAIILENEYIYVVVLPELGGRIYTAYDKTNNYDFAYHNRVIKPALVGLLGPWISGGIEFNWPQHHRPSTYMPLNYTIANNEDGSVSVYVGEIENMFSLKGMTEIKVYGDKSIIEINAQIYNRSDMTQTFLWWANPAVRVNDYTKTIMPPDVTAVMDHGKRAVSTFPIATGEYYKMDYSAGVDISRYKNIPVPTSFMAHKSNFDFVGGYDYNLDAGIYHFADHHVSPGKKQWTWGNGDFGVAWDRNLTDEDGPYVELMTGCFTDNQPDFTFIAPQEEKTFTQYFMPYKNVGDIKNANRDFCLSLDNDCLKIYATGEYSDVTVKVISEGKTVLEEILDFTPNTNYCKSGISCDSKVEINYSTGKVVFDKTMVEKFDIPAAATACPIPQECESLQDLYLYGMHIEQYRHATRLAEEYYLEGLKRDDSDYRLNNAYGALLLRRGLFKESQPYFEKAIAKITEKNPNPITSEPLFNLAISCMYLKDYQKAYDNFYKCIWTNESKSASFYYMAIIECIWGDFAKALAHVNNSLIFNAHNMKAFGLKGRILSKQGKITESIAIYETALDIDKLDVIARYELNKLTSKIQKNFIINVTFNEAVNLSYDYIQANQFAEAYEFLNNYCIVTGCNNPMVFFYMAYCKAMQHEDCTDLLSAALANEAEICFASRLSDIIVLNAILAVDNSNYLANYYLGNLFYDKKQYELAAKYWVKSEENNDKFPTVKRNLALYYFNKQKDSAKAVSCLEQAYALDTDDSRIMMELFQLYQITGKNEKFLFDYLKANINVASNRDDLYIDYIALVNDFESSERAEELILNRHFHPWEGGEGKVTKLFKRIKIDIAKNLEKNKDYSGAIKKLEECLTYPHNLGEGKLIMDYDNDIYYLIGEVYEAQGNKFKADEYYVMATKGNLNVADDMYYNDTPVDYQLFMAKAYSKLGRSDIANQIKTSFSNYATNNYDKETVIDYFAVSLPDMLIWEQDINERNKNFCMKLAAMSKEIA